MDRKDNQRPKSPVNPSKSKASTSSVNNNSNNAGGQQKGSPSRQKFNLVPSPPSQSLQRADRSSLLGMSTNASRPALGYSLSKPYVTASKGSSNFVNQHYPNYPNVDTKSFPRPISHLVGNRASTTKSLLGIDRSRNMRAFVEKAMSEKKVFTCVGVYPAIKNALKKRGWVEKTGPLSIVRSANPAMFRGEYLDRIPDDESDTAWISRNLRDYPPDFIWVIRRDNIDWKNLHNNQVINRFPKAWFTTKVGLVACLQQMHWFSEAGVADTFFPRCYRLCLEDERQAFQEDFRLTACMSYLRHFIELFENKGPSSMVDTTSKITPLSIDFASRQLGNYIRMRRHEDIDWLLPPNFMSQHWEAFIHQYYLVVHDKKKIRFDNQETIKIKYEMAKKTLQRIGQYWPQAHLDGVFNMWICKPGARSRGKGIVIMNTLEKIMELLNHTNYRESNWVVQKYMERPMLIYKTKFDIRQWFIITDWSPLTVWFYKESYVRFCTKPYVLEDFHESIHLCNNAIQCRYQNSELRDSALPDENMWDCYTFQAYLKTIGKMDQWPSIYSGMKQAIIGVLLASQETVESKKGCFELYGADFMLSEDFKPWLIEINSCPCMAASTSVTARMCAQCLEDCIKVVIDRKANKNADTGMFEMVYRQNPSSVTVQQFSGHDLIIHGKKLTRDIDWPSMMTNKNSSQSRRNLNLTVASTPLVRQPSVVPQVTENLTFADLLQKLRMKNAQMFAGFVSNTQAQTLSALSNQDHSDKTLTGALLNKMRSLSKTQNNNNIIQGMKKVYPSIKSVNKPKQASVPVKADTSKPSTDASLAFLSKYANSSNSTFADLVRMGQQMAEESENDPRRPGTSSNGKRLSTPSRNPYLPNTADIASPKTLEHVRLAMNAALAESENSKTESTDSSSDKKYENDETKSGVDQSPLPSPIRPSSPSIQLKTLQNQNQENPKIEVLLNPVINDNMGIENPTTSDIVPTETETQPSESPQHENLDLANIPVIESQSEAVEAIVLESQAEAVEALFLESQSEAVKVESVPLIDLDTPPSSRPTTPNPIVEMVGESNNAAIDGKAYDILNNNLILSELVLSSSESDSLSDGFDFSDPDLTRHFIPACSRTRGSSAVGFEKTRIKSSTKPRISKFSRFPCHRVTLQSQNSLKLSGRRSGATLPLKRINLKLS